MCINVYIDGCCSTCYHGVVDVEMLSFMRSSTASTHCTQTCGVIKLDISLVLLAFSSRDFNSLPYPLHIIQV